MKLSILHFFQLEQRRSEARADNRGAARAIGSYFFIRGSSREGKAAKMQPSGIGRYGDERGIGRMIGLKNLTIAEKGIRRTKDDAAQAGR